MQTNTQRKEPNDRQEACTKNKMKENAFYFFNDSKGLQTTILAVYRLDSVSQPVTYPLSVREHPNRHALSHLHMTQPHPVPHFPMEAQDWQPNGGPFRGVLGNGPQTWGDRPNVGKPGP